MPLCLHSMTSPNSFKWRQIDASDLGVEAVLMQQGHPLSFNSKALALGLKARRLIKKST
jgi:hypothetical protein